MRPFHCACDIESRGFAQLDIDIFVGDWFFAKRKEEYGTLQTRRIQSAKLPYSQN
jgi:hypothetical protein